MTDASYVLDNRECRRSGTSSEVARLRQKFKALRCFALGDPDREKFEKIVDDIAAFEKFQTSGGNMPFRVAIEARAISPFDPRLPNVRDDPAQGPLRAHVFQEADYTARLDYAPQLAESRHL